MLSTGIFFKNTSKITSQDHRGCRYHSRSSGQAPTVIVGTNACVMSKRDHEGATHAEPGGPATHATHHSAEELMKMPCHGNTTKTAWMAMYELFRVGNTERTRSQSG